MPDDWRIVCSGDDDRLGKLIETLDLEGVHRGELGVLAYESDEQAAERTYAAMNAAAAALGLEAHLERWNPAEYAWQNARRPVADKPEVPDWPSLAFQVIASFPDRRTARAAWDEPGRYILWRRGRRVAIGARDEEEAQQVVNDLRLSSPIGTEIDVLPHRTDVIT